MVSDRDEDFAALFEASLQARRVDRGQTVEGTVVAIGPEVAFVDVGGKGEALIDIDELKDEAGALEVAVGDRIQAVVMSTDGGLTLSRRLARRAASDRHIEDAFHARLPVEGKVERGVKGGYEVRIARHRAFCPLSQIDIHRHPGQGFEPAEGTSPAPSDHVGRIYRFRITEYTDGGRNLVVSRRALLEEEQRALATEVRRAIVPGAVLTGRVASVVEFGAFVDLGAGVQGLLHVSEMGWSRVPDIMEIARPGEEITVKVLRVDEETGKIALGLKQLAADPWSTVGARYDVGRICTGRVTRLAPFGAFVEIEPGVEGLMHVSTLGPAGHAGARAGSLPVGTRAVVQIASIDVEKRRIGLAPPPEGTDAVVEAADAQDGHEEPEPADAASTEGFGTLADKLRRALTPRQP